MLKSLKGRLVHRLSWLISLTFYCMMAANRCYATSVGIGNAGVGDALSGSITWPWTAFLNSLATQLTGPLPLTLGILGIAAAAIALFAGNGGAGTHKFIMLIFAVSTCLFAPTFIQYISSSAGGMTVRAVLGVVYP